MSDRKDAYWDDLGVAWTAINPTLQTIAPRMKSRLRRQTVFIAFVLSAGIPFSLAGGALGAWTIWLGAMTGTWFFVTRGIAILAISAISAFAAWSFKSALRDSTASLGAMIELALLRTRRWLWAIRLGYFICAIAVIFGTIGYAIRVHYGKPPAGQPEDALIALAILVFLLLLLQRRAKDQVAKYQHLKLLLQDEAD
jgi:hypothetical protein